MRKSKTTKSKDANINTLDQFFFAGKKFPTKNDIRKQNKTVAKPKKAAEPKPEPMPWTGKDVPAKIARAVDRYGCGFDGYIEGVSADRLRLDGLKRSDLTPDNIARAKGIDRARDAWAKNKVLSMGGSWNGERKAVRPPADFVNPIKPNGIATTRATTSPEPPAKPEPRPASPKPPKAKPQRRTDTGSLPRRELGIRSAIVDRLREGPAGPTLIAFSEAVRLSVSGSVKVSEVRRCLRSLHIQNTVKRLKSGRYRLADGADAIPEPPGGTDESISTETKKTRTKGPRTAGSISRRTSAPSGRSSEPGPRARSASQRPDRDRSRPSWDMLFES